MSYLIILSVKLLPLITVSLNNILSLNTGKDLSIIERDTERDYFLDSDEALGYGLIDGIL